MVSGGRDVMMEDKQEANRTGSDRMQIVPLLRDTQSKFPAKMFNFQSVAVIEGNA